MKPEKIPEILTKFENNADRAILIDGRWGIGKTYQLLAHIRKQSRKDKRKKKYVYVSMFGKETIEDIHTELYAKMNPGKNSAKKAIRLIPKVAPLIVGGVDLVESLRFALKTETNVPSHESSIYDKANQAVEGAGKVATRIADLLAYITNKIKKRKKKQRIVVFDDFERLDFTRFSMETLLGYFHNLMLQGIKIVVACSEKEIYNKFNGEEERKKVYREFKEKVFDRNYSITISDEEILCSYWGDDSKYLTPQIIEEMKGNLRLSQRAAQFYNEIKRVLEKKTPHWREKISENILIPYSIYIIVGTFTEDYKEFYRNLLAETQDENEEREIEYSSNAERYGFKNDLSESVGKILIYVKKKIIDFDKQYGNWYIEWFIGLCKLYYYNDESSVTGLIVTAEDFERNPLLEDVSFLSQEEKMGRFRKQEEYIFKTTKFDDSQLKKTIGNMFLYGYLNQQKAHEIALHVIKNKADNYSWLHDISVTHMRDEIELAMELAVSGYDYNYRDFLKLLSDLFEKSEYEEYLHTMVHAWNQRDYEKLETLLRSPSLFAYDDIGDFKPEVIHIIKDNNYFIGDIIKTISPAEWACLRYVKSVAKKNDFWEEMKGYIQTIDDTDDLTVQQRKRSLLGK